MAKDLRIAADLSKFVGLDSSNAETIAQIWEEAKGSLDKNADHTAIYRFLASAVED
jgi:3-hydroxyisobutyrate dehydrogenase